MKQGVETRPSQTTIQGFEDGVSVFRLSDGRNIKVGNGKSQLFNILYSAENPMSAKSLAVRLGISPHTVRGAIRDLRKEVGHQGIKVGNNNPRGANALYFINENPSEPQARTPVHDPVTGELLHPLNLFYLDTGHKNVDSMRKIVKKRFLEANIPIVKIPGDTRHFIRESDHQAAIQLLKKVNPSRKPRYKEESNDKPEAPDPIETREALVKAFEIWRKEIEVNFTDTVLSYLNSKKIHYLLDCYQLFKSCLPGEMDVPPEISEQLKEVLAKELTDGFVRTIERLTASKQDSSSISIRETYILRRLELFNIGENKKTAGEIIGAVCQHFNTPFPQGYNLDSTKNYAELFNDRSPVFTKEPVLY